KLVTADHDTDVRLKRRRPHRRIAQWIIALEAVFDLMPRAFLPVETQRRLWSSSPFHLRDQFRKPGELPGPADNINMGSAATNQFLIFLGHAAEHAQHFARMPLHVASQSTERAINLVLRVLPDAARVEENDICRSRLMDQFVSLSAQTPHDQ